MQLASTLRFAFFKILADLGSAIAQNYVGVRYEESKSYEKALAYFQRAANQNDPNGICNLAEMYLAGKGVQIDPVYGLLLHKKAADLGNRYSQFKVGYLCMNGDVVKKDERLAATYYKAAAEAGDETAQFSYALALYLGNGVETNYEEAAKWYERAALLGMPQAQYNLGLMLADGIGVEADLEAAERWLAAAKASGVLQAYRSHRLVSRKIRT